MANGHRCSSRPSSMGGTSEPECLSPILPTRQEMAVRKGTAGIWSRFPGGSIIVLWSYIRLSWSRFRAGDLDVTRGCKVGVVGGMIRAVSELQGRYSRAQQILLAMRRGTSLGLSLLRQHEPGERQVLLRMWSQTTANFR